MFEALKAAVEEQMRLARAVVPDNGTPEWQIVRDEEGYLHPAVADMNGIRMANGGDRTLAFFAANDPAFVLRQCQRDLKVLERHRSIELKQFNALGCEDRWADGDGYVEDWPCPEIRDLAEVYQINLGVSE